MPKKCTVPKTKTVGKTKYQWTEATVLRERAFMIATRLRREGHKVWILHKCGVWNIYTAKAFPIYDPKPQKVIVTYALTKSDITRNELGEFAPMPLTKALKLAQKMLKGAYVQVTITKK